MANTDSPFGLIPRMYRNGSPWNGKYNIYYIPVGNTPAIFKGDLVKLAGSASADGKYPDIVQAAATDTTNVGVVIGFGTNPNLMFDIDNLTRNYCPASTEMYAAVVDDPDVIYEIQEDSVGGAIAVTAVGNNADVVVGSGSTTTGQSAMELDSSDVKTATAQLRILRLADRPDNVLGTNAKWLVMINESVWTGTAGA
jgi:hypothetical protein